ncbi:DUF2202 domain-containing protein [Chloroflexota bacterium]
MMKKIIVIILLVGLVGILLIGAVNRTLAGTESEGNGQGRGRQDVGLEDSDLLFGDGAYADQGQENEGNGWGRGRQDLGLEDGSLSIGRDAYTEAGKNGGNGQGRDGTSETHEFVPENQGELSEADKEALIFMREEEKLARDVYLAMYELWGMPIFQNISSSEQSHTEAVKTLLDGYNVPDPASDKLGVFTNPDLQILYNDLVARGSHSLAEALRVGAAIEEIDILDLQERLAQTDNPDIQHVFNNLLQGSNNHLRAFTSTLMTQTSETYQPQFMSPDAYQAIIGASIEGGSQGRGMMGGRGGRP